jgi:hypothetical protein
MLAANAYTRILASHSNTDYITSSSKCNARALDSNELREAQKCSGMHPAAGLHIASLLDGQNAGTVVCGAQNRLTALCPFHAEYHMEVSAQSPRI